METTAHIHSLNRQMDTVTIISHSDNNHVVAQYKGKTYTAVYNPFAGAYYVDDTYGLVGEIDHHA